MGERSFKGLNRTLSDFHMWALGDLTSPTTKGMVAEYMVRCAIEDVPGPVLDWDGVDIRTPSGTIEVKSASALSGGPVRKIVRPKFGIAMSAMPWDAVNNAWGTHDGTRRHADVYVFCLHAETDPDLANPLDAAQWTFWIVPSRIIDQELGLAAKSVSLGRLMQIASTATYKELAAAIDQNFRKARMA